MAQAVNGEPPSKTIPAVVMASHGFVNSAVNILTNNTDCRQASNVIISSHLKQIDVILQSVNGSIGRVPTRPGKPGNIEKSQYPEKFGKFLEFCGLMKNPGNMV